jgi:hypothetical protein
LSADNALLQVLLEAATARINSRTGKTFQASADTTRRYDPSRDILRGELWLDAPLSYLTSVINGDAQNTDVTAHVYTNPRNTTPIYSIGMKTSSPYAWEYTTDVQDAIAVIGRFAWMTRIAITALSRSSNVVTATCNPGTLFVGATVYIVGCADTSFNGAFVLTAVTATTISWAQTAGDDTDTTAVLLTCPTDIVTACRRLAAWLYRQKDTQSGDQDRPLLAGDGTVIMPTTLPLDVEKLLQPYSALI